MSIMSPRCRTKAHLCLPDSRPDATAYFVVETSRIKTDASSFADDFFSEHSSSGVAIAPAHQVAISIRPMVPRVSKSAHA